MCNQKQVKDLLFSHNCFNYSPWIFPENDLGENPTLYNPLIDAVFGELIEFPINSEKLNSLVKMLMHAHEAKHLSLFRTTYRGLLQLSAGTLYTQLLALAEGVPFSSASDYKEKLKEFDTNFQTESKFEEIVAVYSEINYLIDMSEDELEQHSESKADLEVLKDKFEIYLAETISEKYDDEFLELYREYKQLVDYLGDNQDLVNRFILNIPIPETFPIPFLRGISGAGMVLDKCENGSNISNIHYSNKTLKERLFALSSRLKGYLSSEIQNKEKRELIEFFDNLAPGFAEGYFYYDTTFIPFVKDLIATIYFENVDPVTMMSEMILTRDYLLTKRRLSTIENFVLEDFNESRELKGFLINEMNPSFHVFTDRFTINEHITNNRLFVSVLPFHEAIRQQIYNEKGLYCLGQYFDFCPLTLPGDDKNQCVLKSTLLDIWNLTSKEFYPDSPNWTKPKCLS